MAAAPAASATPTRTLRDLPAPPAWPLIGRVLGHLPQIDLKALHLQLEAWQRSLGPAYTFGLGPKTVLVIADADLAQAALRQRPETFRRLSAIESVFDEMRLNGVFSVEGEAWRPQRKLVMQALAPTRFERFFPTLQTITDRLRRRWQRAAERGEPSDVVQDLVRFSVDVTCSLSFGQDTNTLEQGEDVIQRHIATVFPMVNLRINLPLPYWRLFRLPQDRRLAQSLTALRAFVDRMIAQARQQMREAPGQPPQNLLQALLQAQAQPGAGITDEQVYANVITLLLAGEDTTAHALAWTLHELAAQPALQAPLQARARAALGEARVAPSLAVVERLGHFEGAVMEALRFKPVVPIVFLEAREATVLGDLQVPAGTPVFLLTRPAATDDRHYAEAAAFRPERWTERPHHADATAAADAADAAQAAHTADPIEGASGSPEGRAHDARAFLQFGAGPRVCPGRHLAGLEMRLALSMLSRNFAIEHAGPPEAVLEVFSFTMMPSALPLRLRALD